MLDRMSLFLSMISNQNFTKLIRFDRQESEYIEPGLLPMFRLFVAIQLLLLLILLFVSGFAPPDLDLRSFILWSLIWMVILMAYLVWPGLPRRLGKRYLPIALAGASVMPVVSQTIGFYFFLDLTASPAGANILNESSWRLL